MLVLRRVRASAVGLVPGRSMRRTEAPASARMRPANGPTRGGKGASISAGGWVVEEGREGGVGGGVLRTWS